ncbi:stage IV sporulation protein FB [Halobacillus dabanensis]|uniref:Stage IV sporulation protein FB n=1 Tax=Halobacillus dabanensis TaxID=240302 RepID=A0A1I3P520_HALDA|nr:site-2 protease family protein [Halobacillus dabanensis]SFJ16502.1 stage IV sporulation protein FB [Halobacillus dabanensis]
MKDLKIHKAVHIHPLFFLLALSAFLTGAIYEFIVLFSIVFIHEMGHFLMACFHGWRVKRMEIWLFGGAVVSEEHNTRPFHEQVLVILAGPLQHIWIYGLLIVLETIVGSHSLLSTAFLYNGIILGFNMLPIWPLDGGKLLFYLSNCWLSFKKSLLLTLFLSIMFMILAGCWLFLDERWTLATILLTAFLLIENALEWKRRPYTQMRYLLYCAYQNREGLKTKYININQDTMVRDVLGNVRSNRHHKYVLKQASPLYIVDEQECLKAFFEKKDAHLKMKDIPEIAI